MMDRRGKRNANGRTESAIKRKSGRGLLAGRGAAPLALGFLLACVLALAGGSPASASGS